MPPQVTLKSKRLADPELGRRIRPGYVEEKWSLELVEALTKGDEPQDKVMARQLPILSYDGTYIHWTGTNEGRVYLPDDSSLRKEIITGFHDRGHLDTEKVFNFVVNYAYWPRMYDDVLSFTSTCHDCQKNKVQNQNPAGELQPLAVSFNYWDEITAFFVTKFPKSIRGHDAVFVVVDRLSKRSVLVPMNENVDALRVAILFQNHVFSKNGTPNKLVSDRDPKFKSLYCKCLAELTNIRLNMSTEDNPQTANRRTVRKHDTDIFEYDPYYCARD